VLGLAGIAAAGMSPALQAVGTAFLGPFELVQRKKRVAFKLGGKERWVIDTRQFAGSPTLTLQKTGNFIHLSLTNARYPGTDLPADLSCELKPALVGWRMNLNLALGGFRCEVPFERWLVGMEKALASVKLNAIACSLNDSTKISLSGSASAEFSPDWVLRFNGSKVTKLSIPNGEILSDSITVSLLGSKEPSLMSPPPARRSLLVIERGAREWNFQPLLRTEESGRLTSSVSPFDVIRIEAGEDTLSMNPRRALLAESTDEETRLFFQPEDTLTDGEGKPFSLPLRNPQLAVAYDPHGDNSALLAQFGKDPVWLHTSGCAFQLGDSASTPPFELLSRGGKAERLKCSPALWSVYAPLPGVMVEPSRVPEGSHLTFVLNPVRSAETPGAGQVLIPGKLPALVKVPLNFKLSVVRHEDLLALDFEFINFNLETGGGKPARLVRKEANKPAYLIVHFKPQSIAEQAFWEAAPEFNNASSDPLKDPPIQSRLSGPSRLAFLIPDNIQEIPYTFHELLSWEKYEQSVVPSALPPPSLPLPGSIVQPEMMAPMTRKVPPRSFHPDQPLSPPDEEPAGVAGPIPPSTIRIPTPAELKPKLVKPELTHTAIEMPYRLILSPSHRAGWSHRVLPAKSEATGKVELWHTRLGVRKPDGTIDEGNDYYRTLRAIWARDSGFNPDNPGAGPGHPPSLDPFRMSLDSQDRHEMVHLSANFQMNNYEPQPIQVERLMLTALGAWLDSRATWMPPATLNLVEWRHKATMGRDHYVQVVYKGYLFPFGHKASLIKVTERKFQATPSGDIAGYLRQRMFIVVRQPVKEYPSVGEPNDGRKNPFKSIRLTTLITPNLDKPEDTDIGGAGQSAFWVYVGGKPFQFHLVAKDGEGQVSEFTTPLIFVENSRSKNKRQATAIALTYNSLNLEDERRKRPMSGQKVAFAKSQKTGDTTLDTSFLSLGAEISTLPTDSKGSSETLEKADQPWFYPTVEQAWVDIPALKQLLGSAKTAKIQFHDTYVKEGFSSNPNRGEVFAQLMDALPLDFSATSQGDKVGGLITPNMVISGLSRLTGPVGGDLNKILQGEFDPKEFFKGVLNEAKILGGITLWDIIQAVSNFLNATNRVPKFITETIKEAEIPREVRATFEWEPKLQNDPTGIFVARLNGTEATLKVTSTLVKKLDASTDIQYEVKGELKNFQVRLFHPVMDFIILKFSKLMFLAKNGKKPDVDADIEDVEFAGPLKYIEELQKYIPAKGFSDPPSLEVTAQGIKLGYSLGIPAVAFGVFSLQNISLSGEFHLPFTGDPARFRFNFCERHNPFLLTVSMFGGGGFFGIVLGLDGVELLEASLEFGGSLSLDIGVASGGVYVMAGIYFKLENDSALLTGYLRCGGSLEVLGIITISVEFYMALTYAEGPPKKVWGEATLTVEIEILFFSTSVDLTVRREFAGSPAPSFADLMDEGHWLTYCEAFALTGE